MTQEIARITFSQPKAAATLQRVLNAFEDINLLDGGIITEAEQREYLLSLELEAGAKDFLTKVGDESSVAVFSADLELLADNTEGDESSEQDFFVYFRLQIPGSLPDELRLTFEKDFGEAPTSLPALFMTHPYEVWADLNLAQGKSQLEIMTLPDNLDYLRFALQHAAIPESDYRVDGIDV